MKWNNIHPPIRWTIKKVFLVVFFTTLVCISTMFVHKRIPLGYMHIGNSIILLVSLYFGPEISIFSCGVGSALGDVLTGYTQWWIPTLLIKSTMALVICIITHKEPVLKLSAPLTFIGAVVGSAYSVVMYTIAGCIISKSITRGLSQIPWLSFEGIACIGIFYIIGFIINKTKLYKVLYS